MNEVTLTIENFNDEVMKSETPVLVDFWATWCGPCSMISPIVSEIADENLGKLKVGKVNVDEQMTLAMKYGVSSIPTLLLFKKGNVEERMIGACSKEELEAMINQ